MFELNFKLHTVIMLVGPTECGKSTFSQNILLENLRHYDEKTGFRTNVQYLSSDNLRQELLGYPYDKYKQNMLEVSHPTFDLFYKKIAAVMAFPVSADFVIVDTTGLTESHRQKISALAEKYHYYVDVIVFDYHKLSDYYVTERSKKLIDTHIQRLKQDVLPVLNKENYHAIFRIKEKNFLNPTAFQVVISDYEEYLSCLLPQDKNYAIIGDVHECLSELKELIKQFNFQIADNGCIQPTENALCDKFILVGDYLDKGGNTKSIIEFLYNNQDYFILIMGNHENFNYLFLNGTINKKSISQETLTNFFTAIPTLQNDSDLLNKFLILVENTKPFVRKISLNDPGFYVTHAPCKNKYIGKLSPFAKKCQRNFRLIRDGEPIEEQLHFLVTDAVFNYPFHFFGHIATIQPFRIHNKVGIDTGVASGNKLTGILLHDMQLQYYSVAAQAKNIQFDIFPALFCNQITRNNACISDKML